MSYQHERESFIHRMTTEGLPLDVSRALLRAATAMQRYAELACSSEAADRDRVPCPALHNTARRPDRFPCLCEATIGDEHQLVPRIRVQDARAEQRAQDAMPIGWRVISQGDPRGYVLRVIPPSYATRNEGRDVHNLDSIGVPARPSRLQF